ncbi:MAG: FGGY family carbohydrate kinase, partial [Anaerolineae bacterium]|nr:FGGY family carbohydrate kinase [Anaerolineae bacterium]
TLTIQHIQRVPFPEPISNQPALFCEIDPCQIIEATRILIACLAPYAPTCEGVVMCGQMQGLVLTDAHATPHSNYISWRDQRARQPHPSGNGTYFDVMMARISTDERRVTGNEWRPSLPVSVLFWLAERNALPRDAIPVSLTDFVLAHLCETTPTTHPTNASVYGVFDLARGDWHRDVIARLGLASLRFPEVQHTGAFVGGLTLNGKRVPCYIPVGDQPCALVGAYLRERELSINISTGSQVALLAPRLQFGDYQTRPFFDGKYLNIVTHIPAGRALVALIELLTEIPRARGIELDAWEYIAQEVARLDATDLRVNLAFFASAVGERGVIENIREDNLTIGNLFRAAFENMAENYFTCAQRLSPTRAWERIVFSGGLAQKFESLREIIAAKFNVPYRVCTAGEDTLGGLALLARVCSGRATAVLDSEVQETS